MSSVSLVIPTINGGGRFLAILKALKKQTAKPSTMLIIDSGSTDGTTEMAQAHGCKVITINHQDFDHGTTRNLGVARTNTEFVVFLTQDAVPADEHTIAELIKPMQAHQNIAICYGRQLPRPNARPLERFAREFNYPAESILKTKNDIETLGLKAFFCSNCCSAIRQSIFNKLGGFKNSVIVNEDMLFAATAITAGYAVYYAAEAKVYHSHAHSLPQTFKRYFNIGRFFADNKWILKHAGLKSYSGDMLKAGIKTFWEKHSLHNIATLCIAFTLKAFACKIGWYYQLLSHSKYRPAENQS